ncbi:hypothetical protein [Caulobacter sp. Root343]
MGSHTGPLHRRSPVPLPQRGRREQNQYLDPPRSRVSDH